jgi:glycerol-3-phosphate dehydrogenase (NAD(P)+)
MAAIVGIVGGGAWGTALAQAAAAAGRDVVLWMRDPALADETDKTRVNRRYLPGIRLDPRIRVTGAIDELRPAGAVLVVVPAQALRGTLDEIAPALREDAALVICAKGIERGSGLFLSDVVAALRPAAPVAVLSGPSFAADVADGLPTAVTLACRDGSRAASLAAALSGPTFRVYFGTDVRGVEIGGAAKNVMAIACGIVQGCRLGESAKAALTARGFAELMRFARAYGGKPETLMGLSGLGDLVLSASSAQSRNFAFGERLGQGLPIAEASAGKLVEGAFTADALVQLARARQIDMPVAEAVTAVLAGDMTIDAAVETLMKRPLKAEHEGVPHGLLAP